MLVEITPEQIATMVAVTFGLIRIAEWGVKSIYALVTGKKDKMSEISDLVGKATNNHLHTIENAILKSVELANKSISQHDLMIKQNDIMISSHEKQTDVLGRIDGKLSK